MNPANNWRCLPEFDGRGVSKVVERARRRTPPPWSITLEKPAALFLATLARTDCGAAAIYHRSSLDADGKWKEPVGTGPFKLGEWKRGQYHRAGALRRLRRAAGQARRLHRRQEGRGRRRCASSSSPTRRPRKAALLSGAIDLNPDINDEDMAEYKAPQGRRARIRSPPWTCRACCSRPATRC